MTCSTCYRPSQYCTCNPCSSSAPTQVDSKDVIYHKSNNELSELTALDLANGSTLELILEAIDAKITPLNLLSTTLTYLRTKYTISNLSQFLVAVSTELGELNTTVLTGAEWTTASRPTTPTEGQDGYNLTLHQREYYNGSSWLQY